MFSQLPDMVNFKQFSTDIFKPLNLMGQKVQYNYDIIISDDHETIVVFKNWLFWGMSSLQNGLHGECRLYTHSKWHQLAIVNMPKLYKYS